MKNDADVVESLPEVDYKYTAICAYSDMPAIGTFQYVINSALRVPDDISIMGYSNFRQSEILSVGLTTIVMPSYEVGKKAAEMIIENSLGNQEALGQVVMSVDLIERESVKEHM